MIFGEVDSSEDSDYKHSAGYILDRCDSLCDEVTFETALGEAMLSITGENPFLSEQRGVKFIIVNIDEAKELVRNLEELGAEYIRRSQAGDLTPDLSDICKVLLKREST